MAKGDPKKPKGKMSAYAFFVQTCREEHKKKNPEVPVNFAEFSKKCSERWKVLFFCVLQASLSWISYIGLLTFRVAPGGSFLPLRLLLPAFRIVCVLLFFKAGQGF